MKSVDISPVSNCTGGKSIAQKENYRNKIVVKVKVPILGTDVELSTPVLIELEKVGYSGAKEDLNKFCERSISGEQESYLELPMIIIGGDSYRKIKSEKKELTARFNITQVPKRMIK